jgi:hypothetical protein
MGTGTSPIETQKILEYLRLTAFSTGMQNAAKGSTTAIPASTWSRGTIVEQAAVVSDHLALLITGKHVKGRFKQCNLGGSRVRDCLNYPRIGQLSWIGRFVVVLLSYDWGIVGLLSGLPFRIGCTTGVSCQTSTIRCCQSANRS